MPSLAGAVSLRVPYAAGGLRGAVGGVPGWTTRVKSSPGKMNTLGKGEARTKVGACDVLTDKRADGGFKTGGGGFAGCVPTSAAGRARAATLPESGGRSLCGGA